jgi:hypothetical protein
MDCGYSGDGVEAAPRVSSTSWWQEYSVATTRKENRVSVNGQSDGGNGGRDTHGGRRSLQDSYDISKGNASATTGASLSVPTINDSAVVAVNQTQYR